MRAQRLPRTSERSALVGHTLYPLKNPRASNPPWPKNKIAGEKVKRVAFPQQKSPLKPKLKHTLQGFGYKNSGFHRLIPGFMCQGKSYQF